jgi:tetratricopeptide (TPR) repeat protein
LPRKETDVLPGLLEQARTLSSRGDLLSAIEAYGRVLTASPEEPVALNELAWIYATGPPDVRDPERALPLAEKAVRRKGDFEFLHTLGVVYLRLGRFPEAVETFMRSARAQGQGITAHEGYFLAICFQRLGMPTLAREYFDKASDWASSHPVSSELESFLREAEEVLGGGTPAQKAGSR